MAWFNQDGLRVTFGTEAAKGAQVGAPCTYGALSQVVGILEVSRMDLSGGLVGGVQNVVIPAGSYILRATLIVTEAFAGATGLLDLGLGTLDANGAISYTNLDEDGIAAAIAVATLTQGSVHVLRGALVGIEADDLGVDKDTLADGYLSYDIDTVDFTAGKALLIVEYVTPSYPDEGAD